MRAHDLENNSLLNELVNLSGSAAACTCDSGDTSEHADSCPAVLVKWKWEVIDILAGAPGDFSGADVVAQPGTPGNLIRIQPLNGVIKTVLTVMVADAAVDPTTVGFGQIRRGRNPVQPNLSDEGTFISERIPLGIINLPFNDGIGRWVDPSNWKCISGATATSPVDQALFNTTVADVTTIVGVAYREYDEAYRRKMGL